MRPHVWLEQWSWTRRARCANCYASRGHLPVIELWRPWGDWCPGRRG